MGGRVVIPISFAMVGTVAKFLMERPDAHVASISVLTLKDDGFDGYKAEVADVRPCKSGPRKGKPNWRKAENRRALLISDAAMQAEAAAWRDRTGLCPACMGDGRRFAGWHYIEGTKWQPCPHCNATGSADGATVSPLRSTVMHEPIGDAS